VTELPGALGGKKFLCWRLDDARHAAAWDRGEGAYRAGGRWNRRGVRAIYCSLDPATAILEVAVHKGFPAFQTVPHILTCFQVLAPKAVHVVHADSIADDSWLFPGVPSTAQQSFGTELIQQHGFVLLPSTVSRHSWNVIFQPERAAGKYELRFQERFSLDARLIPAAV
jgi:RES domain-containing protein